MVSDYTKTNIILVVCTVSYTCEFSSTIEHWANLVDFVKVFYALLEESNTFQTHSGVNVFVGKFTQDFKLGFACSLTTEVLHENKVPNFDVAVFVSDRAALDAIGRTTVEVNFRTRASRTWLAG